MANKRLEYTDAPDVYSPLIFPDSF